MQVDFNEHAETYTADPHVNQFGQLACDKLNAEFPSIIPVGPGSTAFDFGTGGGNVAFRLSSQGVGTVVALDTAENMIKVVKRQIREQQIEGVTPFVGTCDEYVCAAQQAGDEAMPEIFDLITASSVIAFVNDRVATLKCLGKMLRGKDSHIVHWDWLASASDESSGGFTLEGALHSPGTPHPLLLADRGFRGLYTHWHGCQQGFSLIREEHLAVGPLGPLLADCPRHFSKKIEF